MDDERIKKLPVWAQRSIRELWADVEYYRKQFQQVENADETPISWCIGLADQRYIPSRATVSFVLDTGKEVDVSVRQGELHILGGDRISVHPKASNKVVISIED